jgi:AraC-like DNA-binding protein
MSGSARYGREMLASGDGFWLAKVHCDRARGGFGAPEQATRHSLVFARRGAFTRRAGGAEVLLDSTVAYLAAPGTEQRFAHPVPGGDDCIALSLSPALLATIAGDDPWISLPEVPMDPVSELMLRRLPALRHGDPDGALAEQVVVLVAALIARKAPARVTSGRPAAIAHDRLVRQARELVLAEPGIGLIALGRRIGCSPHHLSRVFSRATGTSISGYRNRIRVGRALDRLADGETSLAGLAHDLGFADHAHLTRTVRAVTGSTPAILRATFAGTAGPDPAPRG